MSYVSGMGSISQLAAIASLEMQLPSLRQMIIEKFQTLDRLHADASKYIRLQDYDSFLAKGVADTQSMGSERDGN
jgi:spore coat protein CotF